MARITVENRTGLLGPSTIRYRVLVDGKEVGTVEDDATLSTDVGPGVHEVQLRSRQRGSARLSVNVSSSDDVHLVSEPAATNPFTELYYDLFAPKRYIKIRRD